MASGRRCGKTAESRLRSSFQGLYFSHFFCDILVGVTTNSKASLGGVVNSSVASRYCSSPEDTSATWVSSHIRSLTSTRVGIYSCPKTSCEKQMSQNQRPEDCVLAPQVTVPNQRITQCVSNINLSCSDKCIHSHYSPI